MTTDDTTRRRALHLLRRGLITIAEAAELAGISRQGARWWCQHAGIDAAAARAAYLRKLWEHKPR